jgi:site-specific DNA-methyltransferase (adenine-specific)
MEPWHHDDRTTIYHGDCLEVLRALPDASVDAVVTDPPYGLGFMGKVWDAFGGVGGITDPEIRRRQQEKWGTKFGASARPAAPAPGEMAAFQAWCELWAVECLRVLKPGGHLLAFGGTRTWHRLACAIEDAGFEVRDSIAWLYGSGFPKSLDVSKAIDKAEGIWRGKAGPVESGNQAMSGGNYARTPKGDPISDAAREWSGWGTALKPAHEPIVVARKPLVGTVASNVLEHGTGALNIDGCRIGFASEADEHESKAKNRHADFGTRPGNAVYGDFSMVPPSNYNPPGRWPANVVLDEDQAAELDQQSGVGVSRQNIKADERLRSSVFGGGQSSGGVHTPANSHADIGGASRFFYVAKAPAKERPKVDGTAHPTVKPLTLMRWLCRLVTPPDGVILEPFAGSGTTIEAALLEGFRVVGIEREAEYLPLIQARLDRVAAIEPDDEQLTLDASA